MYYLSVIQLLQSQLWASHKEQRQSSDINNFPTTISARRSCGLPYQRWIQVLVQPSASVALEL